MGSNIKKPTKNELKIRKLVRKSIIAKKPIKKENYFLVQISYAKGLREVFPQYIGIK